MVCLDTTHKIMIASHIILEGALLMVLPIKDIQLMICIGHLGFIC